MDADFQPAEDGGQRTSHSNREIRERRETRYLTAEDADNGTGNHEERQGRKEDDQSSMEPLMNADGRRFPTGGGRRAEDQPF